MSYVALLREMAIVKYTANSGQYHYYNGQQETSFIFV